MDSDALDAVRLLATRRLPGLVVTDQRRDAGDDIAGVSRLSVCWCPRYVQEDPSLAGVLSESMADRIADKLERKVGRGGAAQAAARKWRP